MLQSHSKGLGVPSADASKQARLGASSRGRRGGGQAPNTFYLGHSHCSCLRPSCEAPRQDAMCCSTSSRCHASWSREAPHLWLTRSSGAKGRRLTVAHSKRGRGGSDGEDLGDQGFGISQRGRIIDVNINGNKFSINRDNLWALAVPAAGVLALAASIGPIIIGLVFAAAAVGAALSFGAFALSFLWVPFLLAGIGAFIGTGVLFGGFASVGLGLFLPKLIGLGVIAAGMGLGALGTGWLVLSRGLRPGGNKNNSSKGDKGLKGGASGATGPTVEAESKPVDENEEEVRRMARELRDFDIMMAEKEERARVEEWKNRSR